MKTARKSINELTSNQLYGGMNRRFDNRAARLRQLGFTYVRIAELGIAVFTRNRWGKVRSIPAAVLHQATGRVWIDQLRSVVA